MVGEFEEFDDGIIIGAKIGDEDIDKDGNGDGEKEGDKDLLCDLGIDGVFSGDEDTDGNSDNRNPPNSTASLLLSEESCGA